VRKILDRQERSQCLWNRVGRKNGSVGGGRGIHYYV